MTDTTREQIAARLRQAREASGLSQGQVAKFLNLHRPTVTEIEAGRRRVSGEELKKMANLYKVSIDWITASSDKSNPSEEKILLAARELSKMKDDDLDNLLSLLKMLRTPKGE